jgi:hypothetical protein
VALNKVVTLKGTFFVGGWPTGYPSPAATVVDGIFLTEGTEWDKGSVWRNSNYGNQNIVISLRGFIKSTA